MSFAKFTEKEIRKGANNGYDYLKDQLKAIKDNVEISARLQVDDSKNLTSQVTIVKGNKNKVLNNFKDGFIDMVNNDITFKEAESLDLIIAVDNWINRKEIIKTKGAVKNDIME